MDGDLKEAEILRRLSMSTFPATAIALGVTGLTEGGLRYGLHNYTIRGGSATEHIDGAIRHLLRWYNGEPLDEHGVHNLGLAIARVAILIDLRARGMLVDDRPPKFGLSSLIDHERNIVNELLDKSVNRIVRYTDKNPTPTEE